MMNIRIERLDRILGRFDPELTESQDRQHRSYSALPTNVLLMAQELVKVKDQLKSGVQIVGRELAPIDDQVQLQDLESQKVQESFAAPVAERLGETDNRQADTRESHLSFTRRYKEPRRSPCTRTLCWTRGLSGGISSTKGSSRIRR